MIKMVLVRSAKLQPIPARIYLFFAYCAKIFFAVGMRLLY
jgi:hypothetical protein